MKLVNGCDCHPFHMFVTEIDVNEMDLPPSTEMDVSVIGICYYHL